MLSLVPRYLYLVLLVCCCSYALWRGRFYERAVALICVVASFATVAAIPHVPTRYRGIEPGVAIVDLIVLLAFAALARHSRKPWLLWITALQLIAVCAHVARLAGPLITPFGYQFLISIIAYPILILLAVGTRADRRYRSRTRPGALAGTTRSSSGS